MVAYVRIGAETVPLKVASYLMACFKEKGSEFTAILQAVGPVAALQSLKAVARLQQMVAEEQAQQEAPFAGACVVFKPSVALFEGNAVGGSSGGSEPRMLTANKMVVTLGTKADWPAEAFTGGAQKPAGGGDAAKAAAPSPAADAAAGDDAATSSSTSSGSSGSGSSGSAAGASSGPLIPTPIRPDNEGEQERLYQHAVRSTKISKPAAYAVSGSKLNGGRAAQLWFKALSQARRSVNQREEPGDLQCTLISTTTTVERRSFSSGPVQGEGEAADAGDDIKAAAAGGEGLEAAAAEPAAEPAAASGDAGVAAESTTYTRIRFVLTVQQCAPTKKQLAAAARRQSRRTDGGGRSSSSSGGRDAAASTDGRSKRSSSSSSSAPGRTRPGYVEVREEEWLALKEQLEVVPHLTEQLQIMTRQHEQLLSLLAAQQQQDKTV